jgi:hypothetical protein
VKSPLSARRLLGTFLVLAVIAVAPRIRAEVTTVNGATWITGEIMPRDVQLLRERKREGLVVHLNTGGGFVTSAIAIGRLLREMKGVARVDAGSSCLSACVFVLAGAPYRVVQTGASIGIHRPYDPDAADTSPEHQKLKYEKLDAFVKAYLKEVNVPPALYAAMMKAPEVRMLPPSELSWYGLDANDRNHRQAMGSGGATPREGSAGGESNGGVR